MEPHQQLEREFAHFIGYPPANVVVCSSGTAALHLALESLRLPPGSEVVTSDFNMIAVPRAISLAGLVPVFVDCRDDLLMSPELTEQACERKYVRDNDVSAILAVHIYGRCCDMESIAELAGKHQLVIVEDLAEAHGVKPHPRTDAACYSFYRNKIIAGEEGGAAAFRSPEHAALGRQLRSLGFTEAHDFNHISRGHNYRLANALALPILESLADVRANLDRRRLIERWYEAACPQAWRMPKRDSVWVYDTRISGLTRAQQGEIVRALNEQGIAARHSFWPIHLQEEYHSCRIVGNGTAERMAHEVFYLPAAPGTVTANTPWVAFDTIRSVLEKSGLAA